MKATVKGQCLKIEPWTGDNPGKNVTAHLLQNGDGRPEIAGVTFGEQAKQKLPKVGDTVEVMCRIFKSQSGAMLVYAD